MIYNKIMNKLFRRLYTISLLLVIAISAQAQRKNARYVDYVNTYKDLAIQHMKDYKIPASITLA